MRKKFILWLSLLIAFSITFHSCRTEDLADRDTELQKQLKITILTQEQLNKEPKLLQRISKYKENIRTSNSKSALSQKTNGASILDDAIIGTKQVVRIENNEGITYTFPVFRTYLSDKIENLILKKREDGSFSGVLLQYNTTKEEKDKYRRGEYVDLMKKLEVFPVDNLQINTASRIFSLSFGCVTIEYETGMCSAGVHESGDVDVKGCTVGGPPPIQIVSISVNCSGGGSDNGGDGGTGVAPPYPSMEPNSGFTTFPFVSIGYEYFATEDLRDPNYVLYNQVNNFFSSQGSAITGLMHANPDLFYYTFFYFKENGANTATKAFISQRLTGLNNWYIEASKNGNVPWLNNQYFLNWAFWHLVVEDPTQTWDEFYNQFLATPCEKIKTMLDSQKNKDIIKDLKDHLTKGAKAGEKGWRDNKTGTPTETTQNGDHSVNFGDPSTMNGGYHNHTGTGVNIFSATDISTLIEIARYQAIGSAGNAYMVLIAPGGIHYVMYFNGTHNEIPTIPFTPKEKDNWNTFQAYWKDNLRIFQKELYATTDGKSINSKGLEKIFFDTIKEMDLKNKIILQRVEDDKTLIISQNSDGTTTTNPCPN